MINFSPSTSVFVGIWGVLAVLVSCLNDLFDLASGFFFVELFLDFLTLLVIFVFLKLEAASRKLDVNFLALTPVFIADIMPWSDIMFITLPVIYVLSFYDKLTKAREAYCYFEGLELWNQGNFRNALKAFKKAAVALPQFRRWKYLNAVGLLKNQNRLEDIMSFHSDFEKVIKSPRDSVKQIALIALVFLIVEFLIENFLVETVTNLTRYPLGGAKALPEFFRRIASIVNMIAKTYFISIRAFNILFLAVTGFSLGAVAFFDKKGTPIFLLILTMAIINPFTPISLTSYFLTMVAMGLAMLESNVRDVS